MNPMTRSIAITYIVTLWASASATPWVALYSRMQFTSVALKMLGRRLSGQQQAVDGAGVARAEDVAR